MKLKTSITILGGCLVLFIFIFLPVVLSIQEKKEDIVASYVGSSFSLKDVNDAVSYTHLTLPTILLV